MTSPLVSVCIVTRFRTKELGTALGSCFAQNYRPLEVLVFCDEADAETADFVNREFPGVRFFSAPSEEGIPQLRNRGFREAKGEYFVSLDDDAYYSDPDTINCLVADFEAVPGAVAVAMPFIEPLHKGSGPMRAPAEKAERPRLRNFTGCAHGLRREVALQMGGYREHLSIHREDREMSIHLLDCGCDIIYGTSPPIVHLYSPNRDRAWRDARDIRSTLIFDYLNIPHPYLGFRLFADSVQLALYKFGPRNLFIRTRAVMAGLAASWRHRAHRGRVSRKAYRLYRSLPGHGPEPWSGEIPEPVHAAGGAKETEHA